MKYITHTYILALLYHFVIISSGYKLLAFVTLTEVYNRVVVFYLNHYILRLSLEHVCMREVGSFRLGSRNIQSAIAECISLDELLQQCRATIGFAIVLTIYKEVSFGPGESYVKQVEVVYNVL